jgi:septal ring factor EnvC (AmiA/AmiB activator)
MTLLEEIANLQKELLQKEKTIAEMKSKLYRRRRELRRLNAKIHEINNISRNRLERFVKLTSTLQKQKLAA